MNTLKTYALLQNLGIDPSTVLYVSENVDDDHIYVYHHDDDSCFCELTIVDGVVDRTSPVFLEYIEGEYKKDLQRTNIVILIPWQGDVWTS